MNMTQSATIMSQALVWFVDKNPRSRRPVQYRRLDDLISDVTASDSLLPVLLPCPLCCADQQITASAVAHQLQKNRKRPNDEKSMEKIDNPTFRPPLGLKREDETASDYGQFLQLCEHVECMMESSVAKLKPASTASSDSVDGPSNEDDMRL